jgi:D-alanyl-D-alanine carboxypeptidase/D-alanyl-D-alanine-endopeptidase (penicillin-binding protein 4)
MRVMPAQREPQQRTARARSRRPFSPSGLTFRSAVLAALAGSWALASSAAVVAEKPAPAAASAVVAARSLKQSVAEFGRWVRSAGGTAGVAVVELESGAVLASLSETLPLNPASNQKLLTAAAALKYLGGHYRYETGVYGAIERGRSSALVLRGHGDPSLGTADLWRLANALVQVGLARVDGDILVDQSRFDDRFVPPAFEQQPNEWASFRAPVSAVALERNTVTLNVLPEQSGAPAKFWFYPPGFVRQTGTVTTKPRGAGQSVLWSLKPEGTALRAELGGHIAEGLPRLRFVRRVDDPRKFAGYVFLHLLRTLGVTVTGSVELGGHHEKRRLSFIESAPLAALLFRVGKNSDNFYAEMILKTLGAEKRGAPGSSESGAEVVRQLLLDLGLLAQGTRIANGSGLFDANRVSALQLARVLRAMNRDPAVKSEFLAQLAVGGVDGTLHSRFRARSAARMIRAKSGSLRDVVSLSGYVLGAHRPVAFSMLVNNLPGKHAEVRAKIDELVERLASVAGG